MDKKTFIQFIIVSAVVLLAWEAINRVFDIGPRPAQPDPVETVDEPLEKPDRPDDPTPPTEVTDDVDDDAPVVKEDVPVVEEEQPDIQEGLVIENDKIRTEWTNRGAALQKLQLLEYKAPYFKDDSQSERPVLTLIREFNTGTFSDMVTDIVFYLVDQDGSISRHTVNVENLVYEVLRHTPSSIVFEAKIDDKIAITKSVNIDPDTYHYKSNLEFRNLTDDEIQFEYSIRSAAGIERETLQTRYLASAVALRNNDKLNIELINADSINGSERIDSPNIAWAGMVSQYFTAMLWPETSNWIRSVESVKLTETGIKEGIGRWSKLREQNGSESDLASLAERHPTAASIIQSRRIEIPANETESFPYKFIAVPLLSEILDSYAPGLASDMRSGRMPFFTRVLSLGTITFLAPLMVWILDFFYMIIPNYGIAIILLTLLIRGTLHPLTRSSQLSMHKMKKLQPHLQELMKKYGDDRQKMAQEQWKLYSKYGVHPMKGCFPMLLQMPVFLALFKTLRTSVQLRQATFIPGWITDLSRPDTVWQMPISLPILGNDFNVLPFIMIGAWMLNQQLTPTPADPKAQQQQKIMKWMPVLFAFMFYNFASGLLLYITCSSMVGAFEHWLIRKKSEGLELVPVAEAKEAKNKDKTKKTSHGHLPAKKTKKGWMQRLLEAEEMSKKNQKIQNKNNKNNKNKKE